MNAKAMNILYCTLERNEFNHISICLNAHDIWHLLEVTHEGTNKVKESKISMLVHLYELFKTNTDESITEIFTRFTGIINDSKFTRIINELNALGMAYVNSYLVKKLLQSLPKSWEAKVTTIKEAKDLSKLPLEELIGSLMTYKITMQDYDQGKETNKKKFIALKSSSMQESDEAKNNGSFDDDEGIAMMVRKF